EVLMPTIQPSDLWVESGRYEAYGDEMLRIKDRGGRDMLYGPTNEEMITDIIRTNIRSYKQLPKILYHIQWKFRDEVRPRFGVMRGREFFMKDGYSFDVSKEAARVSYYKMFASYLRTFRRLGLQVVPVKADPGPIGGDLSHEFVVLAENGESDVFLHKDLITKPIPSKDLDFSGDLEPIFSDWTSLYAATDEMHDEAVWNTIPEADRLSLRGIEVGHIFYFGTKYSVPMKAKVQTAEGTEAPLEMGSYGIGVSRLVGALIEASHDEHGPLWPISVAPFEVGLINVKPDADGASEMAHKIDTALSSLGIDVLHDDTSDRAGEKFARMDLCGVPYQIILGPKSLAAGEAELKNRRTGEKSTISCDAVVKQIEQLVIEDRQSLSA
ncbi:MAG: proline--tRNA ligase, partial [Pseudomonadota bacterium]